MALERGTKEHGSWERMFGSTHITQKPEYQTNSDTYYDAITHDDVVRDRLDEEYDIGHRIDLTLYEKSWNSGPMRTITKMAEVSALSEHGITFHWATADLQVSRYLLKYSAWQKLCRLAAIESVERWEDLSVWSDRHRRDAVPTEAIIDEALETAERAATRDKKERGKSAMRL